MKFSFLDYNDLLDNKYKYEFSPELYDKFTEMAGTFSSVKTIQLDQISKISLTPPNAETIQLIEAWRQHITLMPKNDVIVIDSLTELDSVQKMKSSSLDGSAIKIQNSGMYGHHALLVLDGEIPRDKMYVITKGCPPDPNYYSVFNNFGKKNKAEFKTKPQDRIKKITTKEKKSINPLLQSLISK